MAKFVPSVETIENRVLCDGSPGAGVNDEGPVMTMQEPIAPGPDGEFDFSSDPEPSPPSPDILGLVVIYFDPTADDKYGPKPAPGPVSAFD